MPDRLVERPYGLSERDCRWSRPTPPFPPQEYERRLARLQRRVEAAHLDALIVEGVHQRLYWTGLRATNGRLIVCPGAPPRFDTDFRYLEMARATLPPGVRVVQIPRHEDLRRQLGPLARAGRWRRVGYEARSMGAARHRQYVEALDGVAEWVDFEPQLLALRSIKSPAEIARLRRAVEVNDRVFAALIERVRPGMTEWQIHTLVRTLMAHMGQGEGWESIIAAGANSSRCHHHTTDAVLARRAILLVDMGVKVDDYVSDMTRTVFFGKPSPTMRAIYDIVLEANRRAIAAIKPGVDCRTIDATARGYIERAGYGSRFGHGLGHGIGLEVHEEPYFHRTSPTRLAPGMVVTVEPGIYLPGRGGVRIEDVVLVTRRGCEVLTRTPTELKVL